VVTHNFCSDHVATTWPAVSPSVPSIIPVDILSCHPHPSSASPCLSPTSPSTTGTLLSSTQTPATGLLPTRRTIHRGSTRLHKLQGPFGIRVCGVLPYASTALYMLTSFSPTTAATYHQTSVNGTQAFLNFTGALSLFRPALEGALKNALVSRLLLVYLWCIGTRLRRLRYWNRSCLLLHQYRTCHAEQHGSISDVRNRTVGLWSP
jgi:hypothetical protein